MRGDAKLAMIGADIVVDLKEDGTYTVRKNKSGNGFAPRNQRVYGIFEPHLAEILREEMRRRVRIFGFGRRISKSRRLPVNPDGEEYDPNWL